MVTGVPAGCVGSETVRQVPERATTACATPAKMNGSTPGPRTVVGPAVKTLNNFFVKLSRLYEQGADSDRIGNYVKDWGRWSGAIARPSRGGPNPAELQLDRRHALGWAWRLSIATAGETTAI